MPRVRIVSPEVAAKIFEKAKKENLDSGEIQELFSQLPGGEEVTWSMISRWRREWEAGQGTPKAAAPSGEDSFDDLLGLGETAPPAPAPKAPKRKAPSVKAAALPTKPAPAPLPAGSPLTWRAMSWTTADGEILNFAVPEVWAAFVEESLSSLRELFL